MDCFLTIRQKTATTAQARYAAVRRTMRASYSGDTLLATRILVAINVELHVLDQEHQYRVNENPVVQPALQSLLHPIDSPSNVVFEVVGVETTGQGNTPENPPG